MAVISFSTVPLLVTILLVKVLFVSYLRAAESLWLIVTQKCCFYPEQTPGAAGKLCFYKVIISV